VVPVVLARPQSHCWDSIVGAVRRDALGCHEALDARNADLKEMRFGRPPSTPRRLAPFSAPIPPSSRFDQLPSGVWFLGSTPADVVPLILAAT
jgi:hypothetical protein